MKLYIPNPQKWVDFFDRVSSGSASLNQSGGGRRLQVISVDHSKSSDNKQYPVRTVLPAEQTTAQAKSELQREDKNSTTVADMLQTSKGRRRRGIKRKKTSKRNSNKRVKRQSGAGKTTKRAGKKYKRRKHSSKRSRDIFEIN